LAGETVVPPQDINKTLFLPELKNKPRCQRNYFDCACVIAVIRQAITITEELIIINVLYICILMYV
jgi:hypothetical protein